MIDYLEKDGRLTFKVRVVPRASRSEIVGEHDGALRVRIAAPPVEGAANEELVRTLAHAFKVARGAIEIVAGNTSKLKTVRVTGLELAALASLSTKFVGASRRGRPLEQAEKGCPQRDTPTELGHYSTNRKAKR